jgi:hypothetical protein
VELHLIFQPSSYERLGSDLFISILAQCCMSIPQFNSKLISEKLDLAGKCLASPIL